MTNVIRAIASKFVSRRHRVRHAPDGGVRCGRQPTRRRSFALEEMALGPLATSFATLTDPRVDRTKDHLLLDIVLIATPALAADASVCAVVCCARPS